MRLGIAYNFFNGEGHLAASLRSVRASAHYICVVQQDISNTGETMPEAARAYPVPMVGPARTTSVWPARHRFFQEDVVAVCHMNFVRRDFGSKFRNTSTTDTAFLDRVANAISGWSYPAPFEFPNKGRFDLSRVENEFAAFDPEEETRHDA